MDSEALRAIQAPLKTQYRDRPDTARVILRAHGALSDGVSCSVETGQALV